MKRLKGIHTDNDPIDQPQGTYRNAKNALISKKPGSICSEEGNSLVSNVIPDGYSIIGDAYVYDNTHILFIGDGSSSEIGIFNGSTYSTVVSDASLNFDTSSVIEAEAIINNEGDIIVYWTDNINPPRFYNVSKAEPISEVKLLNLFPTLENAPKINLEQVLSSGGALNTGSYYFGIALINDDGSKTGYLSFTKPVYINDDSDVENHDLYDGAEAGTQTSKSIQLNLENLDTNYDSYQLAVIRKEEGTIAEVSLLPKTDINTKDLTIVYTGTETSIASSLNEVLINTASYETAKTLVEQDNTLYLGNVTKTEDIGYQQYANNITISSTTKQVDDNGTGLEQRDHYGNASLSFYDKSFKRGEVYAFYISFVLENGQESRAYHIPGRPSEGVEKQTFGTFNGEDIFNYQLFSENGTNGMGFWENQDETYPNEEDWDVYDVDGSGNPVDPNGGALGNTSLQGENVRHHKFPDASQLSKFYKGRDVSNYAETLGIKLTDVKIPSSIIDKIRGVKIYYAKRSDQNRTILDQGIALPMDTGKTSFRSNDDSRAFRYLDLDESGSTNIEGYFIHAFESVRTKRNLGSVSFIRTIAELEGDGTQTYNSSGKSHVLYDQADNYTYERGIRPVKAITYLNPNTYVDALSDNFSYNIDNIYGESGIAVEFGSGYIDSFDYNNYQQDAENLSVSRIVDLVQTPRNVYNSFDDQLLVWTGILETNIDVFDPTVGNTGDGATASGEIDITSSVDDNATDAEGIITITSDASAADDFTVTIAPDITGTLNHTITVAVGASDTKDTVATAIETALNNHEFFNYLYTVSLDTSGTDPILTITAKYNGSIYNGTITIDNTTTGVSFTENDITGGTNGIEEAATSSALATVDSVTGTSGDSQIDINFYGETVNINNIAYDEAEADLAQRIVDGLNGNATIAADWTFYRENDTQVFGVADTVGNNNGFDLDFTVQTVSGDASVTISDDYPDGQTLFGRDADDLELDISFSTAELNKTISVSVLAGETEAQVETKIVTALNGDTQFSNKYTASDNSPVAITADAEGDSYNGPIVLDTTGTDLTYTDTNLTGGSDATIGEAGTIDNVYGGDVFIGFHGTVRTSMNELKDNFGNKTITIIRHLIYAVYESSDNIKFRHQGTEPEEIYYPKSTAAEVLAVEKDNPDGNNIEQFDNHIAYNIDYSDQAVIKVTTPKLKESTNFNSFPTRVIRSFQGDSNTEEDSGLRTFLENDFLEMTRSKGELVKLSIHDNNILAHMERGLLATKGREELVTGDFRAFLGAGDIFSINPDDVVSSDKGIGGLRDRRCTVGTPYGYFFVDRDAGKAYMISDGIKEISANGLYNYFYDELTSLSGNDKLIATYDPKWRRIILTNKGNWTISYYPEIGIWGSYHSYLPKYYLYDLNTFYSFDNDNDIYKHNVPSTPCNFYGTVEDFEFEFIENRQAGISKTFVNFELITQVEDSSNVYYDETFDQYRVSNDRQDSGLKNVVYFDQPGGNARNVEGTWKINDFRNLLVAGSVDTNKPWYDRDRIRGKWAKVKLIFNNSANKSLYLFDSTMTIRKSIR